MYIIFRTERDVRRPGGDSVGTSGRYVTQRPQTRQSHKINRRDTRLANTGGCKVYDFRLRVTLSYSSTPETLPPQVPPSRSPYSNHGNIYSGVSRGCRENGTLQCRFSTEGTWSLVRSGCGLDDRGTRR